MYIVKCMISSRRFGPGPSQPATLGPRLCQQLAVVIGTHRATVLLLPAPLPRPCPCLHRYEEWLQSVRETPSITLPIDDRQYYSKVSEALDYFIYCEQRAPGTACVGTSTKQACTADGAAHCTGKAVRSGGA